jgi:hypothetical protein
VNGTSVANEQQMIESVLEYSRNLENQKKFSSKILEIRIESATAPELTFVDVPGLITSKEEKYKYDRIQLEKITAKFLNKRRQNRFQYMPVLVRTVEDEEHEQHLAKKIVTEIINKYPAPDMSKRINWLNETVFIVNKFDKQCNRGSAGDLIRYMNRCCEYGRTVITMLNPNQEMTGQMNYEDLASFVRRVPSEERAKWHAIWHTFALDDNLPELKNMCANICGVSKMNEIIATKMCEIVRRILPDIERQLDETTRRKNLELEQISLQIGNCDPIRLKQSVTKFNNRFLNYLQNFYAGNLGQQLKDERKTWSEEIQLFHESQYFEKILVNDWYHNGYERSPQALLKLLAENQSENDLSISINMGLVGGPSLERIVDVWSTMVGFMHFPVYSDEDIHNAKHTFDDTKQANMWSSVKSVVLDSIQYFEQACHWLAEMVRYRLKTDAELVFEYAIEQEFGYIGNVGPSQSSVLHNYSRKNRGSSGNNTNNSKNNVRNRHRTLRIRGRTHFPHLTNAKKMKKLSKVSGENSNNNSNNNSNSNNNNNNNSNSPESGNRSSPSAPAVLDIASLDSMIDMPMRRLLERGLRSYKKEIDLILDEFISVAQVVPGDHAQILDKMYCENNINLGGYIHWVLRRSQNLLQSSNPLWPRKQKQLMYNNNNNSNQQNKANNVPGSVNNNRQRNHSNNNNNLMINNENDENDENKMQGNDENADGDNINNSGHDFGENSDIGNSVNNIDQQQLQSYGPIADVQYFRSIYGREINHPIAFNAMQFNCDIIRKLAHAFWIGIKHFVTRDIQQKFFHRVMAPIKHSKLRDDRISNAIQCGTERRELDACMMRLMALTGISRDAMQELVNKAPIHIAKDIAQMEPEEIAEVYGVDRRKLIELQSLKLDQLKQFKILKKNALEKISQIKQR